MKTLQHALCILLLLVASSAAAQTCPPFPARGAQIIDSLVPQYPGGRPGGTDDERRALTRAILEQLVYEFPADGWTWKSADPGRPPSKDALARQVGGKLCVWDWQNGDTRARSIAVGEPGKDITGQNPIPVAGVNHLIDAPAPSTGGGAVVPAPSIDLSAVLSALAQGRRANQDEHRDSYEQAERMFADLVARLEEQKRLIETHDKKPGSNAMSATLGNRYVQIIGAAVGAFVAAQQVK